MEINEDQMESHFATNNRFHQNSAMTLDDLDYYATAFGPVVSAVSMASMGVMTREEMLEVVDKAISECRTLNAALEAEYDGAVVCSDEADD